MNTKKRQVVKIGGSILTQPPAYLQVVDSLLTSKNDPLLIVVSAMSGVTDQLIKIAELSSISDSKLVDEIISFGEIISTKLMSSAFKSRRVDVPGITPFDCDWPIVTDSHFRDANPIIRVCRRKLKRLFNDMASSEIIVISGFLGRDLKGNITTLGRGGSDTTAVLIGHCMNWPVHLTKPSDSLHSCRAEIAQRFGRNKSMTVDEIRAFVLDNPGFICGKALNYIRPRDNVQVNALDYRSKGVAIEAQR